MTPDDGKVSLYLDHSGYTGYDIWNVGFEQTNGKDPRIEFLLNRSCIVHIRRTMKKN
jgi:hypothetical protein